MPVTARLSRKFYDTFGEDLTNELVDWFNNVDATYRADLREFNELNFARFDAKLEQRLAELDAKWLVHWGQLEAKLTGLQDRLRKDLSESKSDLLRWMFAFWAPTALAVIASGAGVVGLLLRK